MRTSYTIEDHRVHDAASYLNCEYCRAEWKMERVLTPSVYNEWLARKDHEDCLVAFCELN